MRKKFNTLILPFVLPALLLIVWQVFAWRVQNVTILPTIGRISKNFMRATDNFIGLGSIPRNIGVSLIRVLSGYTLGVLIDKGGRTRFVTYFLLFPKCSYQNPR